MSDKGEIIGPFRDLPEIPGWQNLSRKKQDALLAHSTNIDEYRRLRMFGEFGELMELYQVQQEIKGEQMKITNFIRFKYSERTRRTIDRKREVFAEIVDSLPPSVMKRWSSIVAEAAGKFARISNASLGEIRSALKEMPPPGKGNPVQFLEQLNTKLLEDRKERRNGYGAQLDKDESARMASRALIRYMRSGRLRTSEEKRQWLIKVVGWAMESHAVTGTVTTERTSLPEGFIPKRGRPFLTPPKEAA